MKWTTALMTAAVIPTVALAQDPTYGRDTARAQGRDTARAQSQQRPQSREDRQVRSESRGNVETARRTRGRATWGLSAPQIRELQQSLQGIDCYDAEIDGVIGPRTRAGIACAMHHHNITGADPNELTQALGLGFQIDAKAGLGSVMRSGARNRGARGMQQNRDRSQDQRRDSTGQGSRDTSQSNTPTTAPPPQNHPPR